MAKLMKTLLFKIDFLTSKHTDDKSLTFLVVTCLDYHFVQPDLVGIGFLKGYLIKFVA